MHIIDRTAEARLVETLAEIRGEADSWTAVCFNLHLLMEQYRSDYQLKIAVNLAADLLANSEGTIFAFDDGGLVVLANHMSSILANKLIFQLRYLCMDDPLAYSEDGHANADFCTVFRLGTDWQKCMNFATRRMTSSARGDKNETADSTGRGKRLSATRMAAIERDLAQIEILPALRRQPVCAITAAGAVKRVFDEFYIHMPHLRQLLKVDVDFLSNKWLFHYLTQLLDARVLALLKAETARYLATPVSVNINLEALLTDWFAEFDASLQPAQKVAVVFEIPVVDVFSDMSAFHFARAAVQKLGYRVCIDGLTTHSFMQINRDYLKADLVKLQWNADLESDLSTKHNQALVRAVDACGPNRVILCRCDSKQAIEYGKALKLSLFQGRHLDSVINPLATVSN
jgi:hypothetical protein